MEDTDDIIPENSLVFSTEQIEYLRSEFERQRKWVNVLSTRESAALEELDHLSWCNKRLDELNERPSYLSPLWYGLSFGMGAIAGAAGDKWSLGFVHETEHQVVIHLEDHLNKLSASDAKTIAILEQMKLDEANHSEEALSSGAEILPDGIKSLMSVIAKVMTKTSYYI